MEIFIAFLIGAATGAWWSRRKAVSKAYSKGQADAQAHATAQAQGGSVTIHHNSPIPQQQVESQVVTGELPITAYYDRAGEYNDEHDSSALDALPNGAHLGLPGGGPHDADAYDDRGLPRDRPLFVVRDPRPGVVDDA